MNTQNLEWGKWDCPEADLEELQMYGRPSRQLRDRVASYLGNAVSSRSVMTAGRGQLLHWMAAHIDEEHAKLVRELDEVAQ